MTEYPESIFRLWPISAVHSSDEVSKADELFSLWERSRSPMDFIEWVERYSEIRRSPALQRVRSSEEIDTAMELFREWEIDRSGEEFLDWVYSQ